MRAGQRVLVVANPDAGGGAGARVSGELRAALERGGASVEVAETRPPDQPDVFAEIDPAAWDAIALVGGDGTFHAAVRGLRSLETPLAFIGMGTVNVLARELDLPAEPGAAAEVILAGETLSIPVLRAGGERFVLFAEAGFLARIVGIVNWLRERALRRHGKLEFVLAALGTLPFAWGRALRVEAELPSGEVIRRRYANALATRTRCYGGTMALPVEPGIVEPLGEETFELFGYVSMLPLGHLVVLALGNLGALERFEGRLSWWGLLERHRVRRVRIDGPRRVRVHADAETRFADGGRLTLPLEIAPDGERLAVIVRSQDKV
jgi:diacylglycerol kinase family enzyme